LTVETISDVSPKLFLLKNFLTAAEASAVIAVATPNLHPSKVVNRNVAESPSR
jgi:hypothetical protein